jgi:hypothetical protein
MDAAWVFFFPMFAIKDCRLVDLLVCYLSNVCPVVHPATTARLLVTATSK